MKSTEAANVVLDSIKRKLRADSDNKVLSEKLEAMAWRFLPTGSIVTFRMTQETRLSLEQHNSGGVKGFVESLDYFFEGSSVEVMVIEDYITRSMDMFQPKDRDRAVELIGELKKLSAWRNQTTDARDERWIEQVTEDTQS